MKWLEQIQRYDEVFYRRISGDLNPSAKTMLARTLSLSGDGWMYALICLVAYLHGAEYANVLFSSLLLAFTFQIPIYLVLKNTLRRQRPYQRLNLSPIINANDKFSFPSGHTSAAFLFATITSAVVPDYTVLVFSWATAIGLSRVALGVHYPTDIVAGAVLGSGIGFTALLAIGG